MDGLAAGWLHDRSRLHLALVVPTQEAWLGTGQTARWADLRRIAHLAEQVGFDVLLLGDHLLYRNTPAERMVPEGEARGLWEAWTILSALAEATTRLQLGPLVACTGFRNPALLAQMAATLDEVSGGRLVLGLGAGWVACEHEAFGFPYGSARERVDRFEEALRIIVPLLREGRVDFQGRYYQARDCELRPRGPRPAGPPIVIGAKRPRMLRLTARYADAVDTDFHLDPATLPGKFEALAAACAAVGRDPATIARLSAVQLALSEREPSEGTPVAPGIRRRWFDVNGLPREGIEGTSAAVAEFLRRYHAGGAQLVTLQLVRFASPAEVERLAPIVEALRR